MSNEKHVFARDVSGSVPPAQTNDEPLEAVRLRWEQRKEAWEALSHVYEALYDLGLALRSDSDWRVANTAEAVLRIAADVDSHMKDWRDNN